MSTTAIILSILGLLSLIEVVILIRAAGRANEADWGDSFSNHLDGLNRLFAGKFHRLESEHIDLPDEGPAIVVANHISGLDPILLMASCKRPLHFLIAQKEYDRPGLKWLFDMAGAIPVERTGRPERALRIALRALEEGKVIALFPYGRIHLDSEQPIRIKGGVGVLASRSGAPVYPARIEGVAGKDSVVQAVIQRGHPKLYPLDPIHVEDGDTKGMLSQLSELLSTPIKEKT
jgi:1-acyl-sn-glycerol-3-phosphate acyltransferase